MHDLRDIWFSFRGKFQVAEINSDAQTIHSFYKYMRKIRAKGIQELERRILILSLLYIIAFVNILFLFKCCNGWLEVLGGWTSIFKE
jgi:flagellar motor component MotA